MRDSGGGERGQSAELFQICFTCYESVDENVEENVHVQFYAL